MSSVKFSTTQINNLITTLAHQGEKQIIASWARDCIVRQLHNHNDVVASGNPQIIINEVRAWALGLPYDLAKVNNAYIQLEKFTRRNTEDLAARSISRACSRLALYITQGGTENALSAAKYSIKSLAFSSTVGDVLINTENELNWQFYHLYELQRSNSSRTERRVHSV